MGRRQIAASRKKRVESLELRATRRQQADSSWQPAADKEQSAKRMAHGAERKARTPNTLYPTPCE